MTDGKWYAVERSPQVNAKEHIQGLFANDLDENGGAERATAQYSRIEEQGCPNDHNNNREIQWLSGASTWECVQQDSNHHLPVWRNKHCYMTNHIRYPWYTESERESERNNPHHRW